VNKIPPNFDTLFATYICPSEWQDNGGLSCSDVLAFLDEIGDFDSIVNMRTILKIV
jgi:hypothetical protein